MKKEGGQNAFAFCHTLFLCRESEVFLRQYHVDGVEHVVDVFFGDDKGRLEGHDVAADAVLADDEAAVLEGL